MTEEMVPKAKVEAIAANIRELLALKDQEKLTIAEAIRACVQQLRMDPQSYRLRGHETYAERSKIIEENKKNKRLALVYLEQLATMIEDSANAKSIEQTPGTKRQEPVSQ